MEDEMKNCTEAFDEDVGKNDSTTEWDESTGQNSEQEPQESVTSSDVQSEPSHDDAESGKELDENTIPENEQEESSSEKQVETETCDAQDNIVPESEGSTISDSDQDGDDKEDETPCVTINPFIDIDYLGRIDGKLDGMVTKEDKLLAEVKEMHKLYHSEFVGRLNKMQEELEYYRKIDKGRIYDDILGALARVYGNYETLVDEVADPKAKKSIKYMLMDIEDILLSYGMNKLRSEPGDRRNPRHCQVLNRISTDDPEKHDTVVKSYNSGFYIDNRTVIKEVVDIYVYEKPTVVQSEEIQSGKSIWY